MAASVEFEDDNGQVVRYVRHTNGGGLVSPRAWVHEAAMVASTAYVEAGARVGDRSRTDPPHARGRRLRPAGGTADDPPTGRLQPHPPWTRSRRSAHSARHLGR